MLSCVFDIQNLNYFTMKKIFTLFSMAVIGGLVNAQTVTRTPLIEDFTSATCGPCASVHQSFDPLLLNNGANDNGGEIAVIKYQMNWPSPGNDPFYNPDGASRRSYYSVSGIPHVFGDGSTINENQSAIDALKAVDAQMEITTTYAINGTDVDVEVTVNPLVDFSSNIIKLHIVVVEDYYNYTGGTTSQTDYYHVQRKMLPGVGGTLLGALTADEPVTVNESYTFTLGNAAQGNHNIHTSMNNLSVVAFVQDGVSKEVHQASFAAWPTSVNGVEGLENSVKVFPNPANNITSLVVKTDATSQVKVQLVNAIGQVVQTQAAENLNSGKQVINIDVSELPEGLYFANLEINGEKVTKKIMVTH